MIICHEKKFIFISTPKAATHSIYNLLKSLFKVEQSKEFHSNKLDPKYYGKYFIFTVVRNPYDKAVSAWYNLLHANEKQPKRIEFQKRMKKIIGDFSFENFTKYLLHRHIYDNVPGMFLSQNEWHNGIKFDKIIKLEYINEEFNNLPFINKKVNLKDLYSYKKERKNWWDYYDDRTKCSVLLSWWDDFEKFNYSTNIGCYK